MKKKITALVPVRKGSVRVKNKNIKPFAGSNLLKIKIQQLREIDLIDKIVVSSDCDVMLSIAKELGVHIHQREKFFASSEANNTEFFRNLGQSIDGDYFMYSPVTCPLITKETYINCIKVFENVENILVTF